MADGLTRAVPFEAVQSAAYETRVVLRFNPPEGTKKLFYVCCTRAMDNLVVYCENPTSEMIKTAENLFGSNNCYNN